MLGGHCCLSRQTARADERAPRGGLRGWRIATGPARGSAAAARVLGGFEGGAGDLLALRACAQGGQGLGRRRRGLQKLMSEIVDGRPLMGRPRRDRRGEPAIRVAARAGDPSRCPHRRSESLPAPAIRVAARAGDPSRCPFRRSESLPEPAIIVAARDGDPSRCPRRDPSRRLRCLLSLLASPRDRIARIAIHGFCPLSESGRPGA